MKYMRKLITKDGIEGPLTEVSKEHLRIPKVTTILHERLSCTDCEEVTGMSRMHESREYELEREEHHIILIYREV